MNFFTPILFVTVVFSQPLISPINADLRAEYWQARSDDAEAQVVALQKRDNLRIVIEKLRKVCADNQKQLTERSDRQPDCVVMPPVASSTKGTK